MEDLNAPPSYQPQITSNPLFGVSSMDLAGMVNKRPSNSNSRTPPVHRTRAKTFIEEKSYIIDGEKVIRVANPLYSPLSSRNLNQLNSNLQLTRSKSSAAVVTNSFGSLSQRLPRLGRANDKKSSNN